MRNSHKWVKAKELTHRIRRVEGSSQVLPIMIARKDSVKPGRYCLWCGRFEYTKKARYGA